MAVVITPGYSEFFDDEPKFEDLIAGIPTKLILLYCSFINTELFGKSLDLDTQINLWKKVTHNFPQQFRIELANKLGQLCADKQVKVIIFVKRNAVELAHRAMLHPNLSTLDTSTPEQEINIFKAYFLITEALNHGIDQRVLPNVDSSLARIAFRTYSWPIFAHQQEINHDLNAAFQSLKLAAFMAYLSENKLYNEYLQTYLTHVRHSSVGSFFLEIVNLVQSAIRKEKSVNTPYRFLPINPDRPITLLHFLSMNIEEYKDKVEWHHNYKGMKNKPLFECAPNTYCTFSYGLFVNKLYNGFIFDFYHHSGIDKAPGFRKFADFKSKYGKEFSETIIFREIIKEAFPLQEAVIQFSDQDNTPDCYVSIGSTIYLFEFKDYLFPDHITIEASFELIKKHIDIKFIKNEAGKPKGVNQLLNYIAELEKDSYAFEDFSTHQPERSNITIYPIIIHTNSIYTMVDVNDYLNEHFRESLPSGAYTIKDLVLIDLETIFIFLQNFKQDKHAFNNLLESYIRWKQIKQKNFNEFSQLQDYHQAFASIEMVIPQLGMRPIDSEIPSFMKAIFHSLNISINQR